MSNAFFELKAGEFLPAPHACSPWSTDMLHGRLLGGLAARCLEQEHREDGLRFARLTVDLFKNSPLLPVQVETVRVRDGRRIRVADATLRTARGIVGRAAAVLLREGEQPGGERNTTPAWDERPPQGPPGPGDWTPPFDLWRLTDWGTAQPMRAWTRENRPMVGGEELTPFTRAALAADFASPLSSAGTRGVEFINADFTLTLAREPVGELVGMAAQGHLSADGIGTGDCVLHDTEGPIGYCVVTAVANPVPLSGR
ncbi:acyl-CoA thioesterase domain-containing protein [Nonomuraea typhae]|uniref:acyl-CoA thioesterase domain-containing protein n=1 Tax=Nonomuraea typhae TaxID=2603600 RepID=UPI001FE40E3F|nr:acyl-CoA thioesterase domain-containing protein [Nonomuraea typhae]